MVRTAKKTFYDVPQLAGIFSIDEPITSVDMNVSTSYVRSRSFPA
jgi:hypothetical protein